MVQTYLTGVCSPSFDLLIPPVPTAADGRFEMRGIGRERLADLRLEGPTIATQIITVMTRSSQTIRRSWSKGSYWDAYHGARQDGSEPLPGSEFTVRLSTQSKLGKPRTLVFWHEGKKLAGFVTVHGDEKEPLQVHLRPWGAIRGRVVTMHGEPLTGARVRCYARTINRADEDLADKDGHFRIERLTPGLKYVLEIHKKGRTLPIIGGESKNLIVRPGEALDLGDVKVQAME